MKELISAAILLFAALSIAEYKKLGNGKDIAYSAARAFVQLMLLGFVIAGIFKYEKPWAVIPAFLIMNSFAAYTGMKRLNKHNNGYFIPFISIGTASALPLLTLIPFGLLPSTLNVSIPLAGMMIGNTLNTHTIVVDRFASEKEKYKDVIEGQIALGADIAETLREPENIAIKTGLMTLLNNLRTVGLVLIPGITGGMLLAGISPIKATTYQLVIMYMLLTANLITGTVSMELIRRKSGGRLFRSPA